MLHVLIFLVSLSARAIRATCRRRGDLLIENLALRQQVATLKEKRPRPPLDDADRAFWVAFLKSWPAWASRLVVINADTVALESRPIPAILGEDLEATLSGAASCRHRDSAADPDYAV